MALPIFLVGAAIGTYVIGGVALTGAAVAAKYGWSWWSDHRHEEGLVEAYKKSGEDGFRTYAYEELGVKCEDQMNALWGVRGPDVAGKAAAAAVKKANKNRRDAHPD